ncbi:MAG: Ig-like domain repeat protein [Myxococcaceae bacterium]|nr:Ig-like domain repeat protein [Myxococcaceae bacterium]
MNDSLAQRGFAFTDADAGTDTTPPDTRIDSAPPLRTRETSATFSFSFSTPETGGHFECKLPGKVADFSNCTSPVTYHELSQGLYTFTVRAVDASGNVDPVPAEHSWTVDTTAPLVTLNQPLTNGSNATFEFSSNELGAFECRLDTGDFSPCGGVNSQRGIQSYSGLSDGTHEFYVRAMDVAGNVSELKNHQWTVDTSPDTSLGAHPEPVTRVSSATFTFFSSALQAAFECKLDTAEFGGCFSPMFYSPLLDGEHLFAVRAIDQSGRVDSSPVSYSWRVDTVAPDTSLDLKPPTLTNQTSARFQFSSPEADVAFECRCDSSPFTRCANPSSCSDLTEGLHTFSARAVDGAGNRDSTPVSYEWRVDLTPPQAILNAASTFDTRASFTFSALEPASFQCSLDGQPFSPCPTPATYENLAEGAHSFTVRAIDEAGNLGPASALYSWTVDLSAPDTSLVLQPEVVTRSKEAYFSFVSTKEGSSFRCSLDGAAFAPCQDTYSHSPLADGWHTFRVFSIDTNKRQDPSPAFFSWTVDTQEPDTTLDEHPPALTHSREARFVFSSDPGSTFECSLESQAYAPCASPLTYTELPDGAHVFLVRAVDRARNTDSFPAEYRWMVDTSPPDIQLNSRPLDPSPETTASFSFFSRASDVSYFECSLDGQESDWKYVPCTSPFTGNNLPEGPHSFHVRVTDKAGNSSRTPSYTWSVDTTAPRASITHVVTDPTPTSSTSPDTPSATFTFEANEPNVHFECRLDSAAFGPCDSPSSYLRLSDTSHTFAVRAIDKAGNIGAPATHAWTVPSQALDTFIDHASPGSMTRLTEATFHFSANKEVSSYRCSLDNAPVSSCSSPVELTGLANDSHTFVVYAIDLGGRPDNTPASHTWVVDTVAPETAFSRCPAALTHQTTLQFDFEPSEPGAGFECSLNGADFTPCSSPHAPLTDGFYTLAARAVDKVGNIDPTSDTCSFRVDTQAPETTLLSKPAPVIGSPFAAFTFTSEPGVSFQCSLDGADFAPCTSPAEYSELPDGAHSFSVCAVDEAGNADATPAEVSFSVAPAPLAPVVEHPAIDDVLATGTPTFQGSAQPGTTVTVFADDKLLGTTRVDEAGRWSLEPTAPLPEGPHTMSATVTNANARTGPPAPPRTFTLDTTSPETTIDSGPPSRRTQKGEATFTFSSTEPRSTFACSLDDADFTPCASPLTLEALGAGTHRLRVSARDVAGNVDKSPAEYTWTLRVPLTGHGGGLNCGSTSSQSPVLLALLGLLGLALRASSRSPRGDRP